ncbi:MAG: tRNA threonylcarbamoyladenosine dehydratase, partial [Aquabacterium sp.]|nr:tRNA threonylcarbamoyladenosine dehydratase [Aquabacterium sp.]
RYRLRRHHGAATSGKRIGVAAVFSRENVVLPEVCENGEAADGSLNCHGYGSSVAVTGTFGLCAAGWVSNQLARNVEKTAL